MAESISPAKKTKFPRDRLAELLNEDLSREYQAIIAYVVYSQVLTGAHIHGHRRPARNPRQARTRSCPDPPRGKSTILAKCQRSPLSQYARRRNQKTCSRFDLDNENETFATYRDRVRQCEALGEYAMAEQIRQILMQEQDHQIDLATALGIEVPDVSGGPKGRTLPKRR